MFDRTVDPEIFSFLSDTEKYCRFAGMMEFGKFDKIYLLDENKQIVRELNSDDFIYSRGYCGRDPVANENPYYNALYYKSEIPVTFRVEVYHKETERNSSQRAEEKAYKIDTIVNDGKCIGCAVCKANCPVGAITMATINGYIVPNINNIKCNNCGKCAKVCPECKEIITSPRTDDIYLCKGTEEFWRDSKSGGVFPIIAKAFIENGGCVVGAILDEDATVRHILTYEWENVEKMRGSKYVQSNISGIVGEIKAELKKNAKVLFTGTPCQVHAIKNAIGENQNLFTIDLWCHGVGSPAAWKRHVREMFGDNPPVKVMYGNKEHGQISEIIYTLADGSKKHIRNKDDAFYQGLMREERMPACIDCRFSQATRQGDFTIGDLWYATKSEKYSSFCNGNIPPSFIMFNTPKSKLFFEHIKANSEFFESISFNDIIAKNRWGSIGKEPATPMEHKPIVKHEFPVLKNRDASVEIDSKNVCLYGHVENENYGGCLTYFSLGKAIESLGYSLTVIPRSSDVTIADTRINFYNPESYSVRFFNENFKMAERLPFSEFYRYNDLANTFVLGSDMIWKDSQYKWMRDTNYLNFVSPEKNKVAYSTSFGTDRIEQIFSESKQQEAIKKIKKFDSVSVREDWAKQFLRENGVRCAHKIDPIFLTAPEVYKNLSERAINKDTKKKFNFAYLLNRRFYEMEFRLAETYSEGLETKYVCDGHEAEIERTLTMYPQFENNVDAYQFLWYIVNAEKVITDSFHGVCLCLILNKPFIYVNSVDAKNIRVKSLFRQFGIEYREKELIYCDWESINATIEKLKYDGLSWLNAAIVKDYEQPFVPAPPQNSNVCIYSMIKNEQMYLDEWLQYHLKLGIKKIILIEDNDSLPHDEIVEKYKNVELLHINDILPEEQANDKFRQRHIINWFNEKYKNSGLFDWAMFIDVDEYLHLEITLDEFCERFSDCCAVHLFWKCFNANGHYKREIGTQYELYANENAVFYPKKSGCSKFVQNMHSNDGKMRSIHQYEGGVNALKEKMNLEKDECVYTVAWLDHFMTRSYEDWLIRLKLRPWFTGKRELNTFFLWNPDMKVPTT